MDNEDLINGFFEFYDELMDELQEDYDEATGFLFGKKKGRKRGGIFGKIGSAIKTASTFVKKNVESAAKDVGEAASKVADKLKDVAWIPLVPFKLAMKKALKLKGHNPPSEIKDLAPMFYRVIVQGKANYDFDKSFYDEKGDFAPAMIPMIVKGIITFLQGVAKKKADGEPQPKYLEELGDDVKSAGLALINSVKAGGEQGVQQFLAQTSSGVDPKNVTIKPNANSGGGGGGGGGGGFKLDTNMMLILGAVVAVILIARK